MEHTAKFFMGQIVHHKKFDYRGVVFDVDATFQGTDDCDGLARPSTPGALVAQLGRPVRASFADVTTATARVRAPEGCVVVAQAGGTRSSTGTWR